MKLPVTIAAIGAPMLVRYAKRGEIPGDRLGSWRALDDGSGEVLLRRGLGDRSETTVHGRGP